MIRETDTTTEPCQQCFGRGALLIGPNASGSICRDCCGTGSAAVKRYVNSVLNEYRDSIIELVRSTPIKELYCVGRSLSTVDDARATKEEIINRIKARPAYA